MQDNHRDRSPREPFDDGGPVELTFAPDDEGAPTEVTVFPEHLLDVTTTWLTIDADHVVDLSEHA